MEECPIIYVYVFENLHTDTVSWKPFCVKSEYFCLSLEIAESIVSHSSQDWTQESGEMLASIQWSKEQLPGCWVKTNICTQNCHQARLYKYTHIVDFDEWFSF